MSMGINKPYKDYMLPKIGQPKRFKVVNQQNNNVFDLNSIQTKLNEINQQIQQEQSKKNSLKKPPNDIEHRLQDSMNKINEFLGKLQSAKHRKNDLAMNIQRYKND